MKRPGFRSRGSVHATGGGMAWAGTLAVHLAALAAVIAGPPAVRPVRPPVYRVELVAAPAAEPGARRAPEVVERPAEQPAPVANKPPERRTSIAKAPPPPARPDVKREPAPRTTAAQEPAPGVQPSTGTDVATVKTSGVEFPFPEYLRNLVAQVYRRWQRPEGNSPLQAEVLFLVNRDGSVTGLQFVRRSGNFGFDLEAQGAIEAAGNARAFGSLPEGYDADVLPVSFFFNPGSR